MTLTLDPAPGLHHVVQDLRAQLVEYERLPADLRDTFEFSITTDEARRAVEEFHRTSCTAERLLVGAVDDLFSPDLEKILVTVGACPTLKAAYDRERADGVDAEHALYWHILRSHVIGQDVPEEAYRDALNTPDQLLSDAFPPTCPDICPHQGGVPRTHPAVLSYLRHVPQELVTLRKRLDYLDGNILGMRYRIARKLASGSSQNDPEILGLRSCIADETWAKDRTQRLLVGVAQTLPHAFIQIKTRVKGIGRLAQKIVRTALNIAEGDVPNRFYVVNDQYGIQTVVLTDDVTTTQRFAASIEDRLRQRNAGSIIRPTHYDQSANGIWFGHKLYAMYGTDELSIPIALQFLPLLSYWAQRADHPSYEERQRQALEELRQRGKPVDAMLAAVERALAIVAQR